MKNKNSWFVIRDSWVGLAFCVFLMQVLPSTAAQNQEEEFLQNFLWSEVQSMPAGRRPKVALVMGGGGARGLAHIGVLKVLEREKVPIDIITGTSVGAMVGALYASGVSVENLEKMSEEIGWNQITDISNATLVRLVLTERLLSTERMESYLVKHMGRKRFSDLNIPFACVATDIQTGEKIIFDEGPVAPAVRASATIPGVFQATKYRHRFLVDGGITDNIPTDIAKRLGADIIIAVVVRGDFKDYSASNVLMVLNQAIYIMGAQLASRVRDEADLIISPQVGDVFAVQLWRGRECVKAGVTATQKMIPEIKRLLASKSFQALAALSEAKQ